ncbi:SCO6880 family protein [Egicoccus sp. AB-alg2]|uniref:SCO6880 family protein n=1 Tax=Egicoccus sp. AB-alg2 TaxID=3242693 RepID=UPI00359CF5DE
MDGSVRRYEFGAAGEDHTVVLGLRAGQLGVLAVALLMAVATVRVDGSAVGFSLAIGVVVIAGVVAFWPVAGRTLEQWVPTVARWATVRALRRDRYLSPMPLLGHGPDGSAVQHPPPTLTDVRLLAAPLATGGREVGVIHDRRSGTYAAALVVRGRSFQLADTPEKQRRLAAWGGVLAGLARASSPVHRLQWIERTVPEDADVMGRYLAESVRVPRQHPTLASYLELVDRGGPTAPQHETLLVVAISSVRARRAIRLAGGGDAGAAEVVLREVVSVQRTLQSADIVVDGILTPRLLAGALRTAFDPSARVGFARRAATAGDEAGTDPANAWPLATATSWASYRTGDVWHATYWVAQWPRSPVGPDFLTPLLVGVTGMRSIAVSMEPVSPLRAHREVEHAVLKGLADEELRARAGFTSTARRRRAQETAARREQELADGHADYRLAGYATVTAGSLEELEAACGEVEQAAQQCSLELRRLDGEQDVAFTWTLPLGRGLQ